MPPPSEKLADVLFPGRDVSFGSVIAALSDASSGPDADNLISNEDSYTRIVGELHERGPKGGVYLGVGPEQNFTLMAPVEPRLAIIVDYRRRNLRLHLLHKALFTLAPDRVAYLTRLLARKPDTLPPHASASDLVAGFVKPALNRALLTESIADVQRVLRPTGVLRDDEWTDLATIRSRLAGPGMNGRFLALTMYPTFGRLIQTPDRAGNPAHFLAREQTFQAIRTLQVGDRVLPLVGDVASETALPRLGEWLRKYRLQITVFYISDVEFFLLRSGRFTAYVENLNRLPWADGAWLVRTSTREIDHPRRVRGDSSTTTMQSVAEFLELARRGRIRSVDDLFRE